MSGLIAVSDPELVSTLTGMLSIVLADTFGRVTGRVATRVTGDPQKKAVAGALAAAVARAFVDARRPGTEKDESWAATVAEVWQAAFENPEVVSVLTDALVAPAEFEADLTVALADHGCDLAVLGKAVWVEQFLYLLPEYFRADVKRAATTQPALESLVSLLAAVRDEARGAAAARGPSPREYLDDLTAFLEKVAGHARGGQLPRFLDGTGGLALSRQVIVREGVRLRRAAGRGRPGPPRRPAGRLVQRWPGPPLAAHQPDRRRDGPAGRRRDRGRAAGFLTRRRHRLHPRLGSPARRRGPPAGRAADPAVAGLARIPLLLAMLCSLAARSPADEELASVDIGVRRRAAEILAAARPPGCEPDLLRLLNAERPEVREAAAIAAAGRQEPAILARLADRLGDPQGSVGLAALQALSVSSAPRLAGRLVALLLAALQPYPRGSNGYTQRAAASALTSCPAPGTLEALIAVLAGGTRKDRISAWWALARRPFAADLVTIAARLPELDGKAGRDLLTAALELAGRRYLQLPRDDRAHVRSALAASFSLQRRQEP